MFDNPTPEQWEEIEALMQQRGIDIPHKEADSNE